MPLNDVETLMAEESLLPMITDCPDSVGKCGIVMLWFMVYEETTGGAYEELVVSILSTRDKAVEVGWVNGLTPLRALTDASLGGVGYLHRLWLDQALPIAYGREVLGLDKRSMRPGMLRATGTGDRVAVSVVQDSDGETIATGEFGSSRSLIARLRGYAHMALALGVRGSVQSSVAFVLGLPMRFNLAGPVAMNRAIWSAGERTPGPLAKHRHNLNIMAYQQPSLPAFTLWEDVPNATLTLSGNLATFQPTALQSGPGVFVMYAPISVPTSPTSC